MNVREVGTQRRGRPRKLSERDERTLLRQNRCPFEDKKVPLLSKGLMLEAGNRR